MSFFETVLSSLFPDRCVGCSSRGGLLCDACRRKLPAAFSHKETFITSAYSYADPRVRRLVKLLKYKNTRHAAEVFGLPLAQLLMEFLGEDALFIGGQKILLVPVPLAKGRRTKRGYNQAELLARAMLKKLAEFDRNGRGDGMGERISIDTALLEKIVDTKPQAEISHRIERLKNLGDCFRVAPGREPKGELVILIDDVTTTGATLLAVRQALLRVGFRDVHALTVAH